MSNHPRADEAKKRFLTLSDSIGPLELIAIIRELEVENSRLKEELEILRIAKKAEAEGQVPHSQACPGH